MPTTPPPLTDDLRDPIATALRTTAATGWTHKPGEEKWDHHLDGGHRYYIGCALCRGDVPVLADAVLAVVQPEVDRVRAERDQARAGAFAEAIDRFRSLADLAPDSERAPGLNFAIGALMAMRDRAARTAPDAPARQHLTSDLD